MVSLTNVPTIKSQTLLQHKIFFLSLPHTLDVDCFLHSCHNHSSNVRLPISLLTLMPMCFYLKKHLSFCIPRSQSLPSFILFFIAYFCCRIYHSVSWASLFSTSDCRTWPRPCFPSQLQPAHIVEYTLASRTASACSISISNSNHCLSNTGQAQSSHLTLSA